MGIIEETAWADAKYRNEDGTEYYEVSFIDVLSGTDFASGALLTDKESNRIEHVLERYEAAGAVDAIGVRQPEAVRQDFNGMVDEIIEALQWSVPDDDHRMSVCQDCERIWPDPVLDQIKDLHERVAAGEPMPSGECPACGALCQPSEPEEVADANV